jgi:hypothetical protein
MKQLFLLVLFSCSLGFGQTPSGMNQDVIEITGILTELGTPLPNITVLEKGTNNVVLSDKKGYFSIKIPVEKFKNKVYLRFESFATEIKEMEVFLSTKPLTVTMQSSNLGKPDTYTSPFDEKPFKIDIGRVVTDIIQNGIDHYSNKH